MGGRHKRKVPLVRRLFLLGLIVSAIIVLAFAFLRPTRVATNLEPTRVEIVVPTTTTTISAAHTPSTTKVKKKKRQIQGEKDGVSSPTRSTLRSSVTPRPSPSKSSVGRVDVVKPAREALAVPRVTPQVKASRTLSDNEPVKRLAPTTTKKPLSIITSSKPPRVTTTPRIVPLTSFQKATTQTLKPKTPTPSPVVRVTSNPKCGTIGLLTAPKAACNKILSLFPQVKTVLGVGDRSGNPNSCHPKGLAIDLIVGTDKALGDRLFAYVTSQRSALGATPVILWQVPDHFDHVHVSFAPCKG
jgi:hypothetical protein